jgi:hypothetical protein
VTNLSLVAVDENGMVRPIQNNPQSFRHLARGDFDTSLIGGNRYYKMLDVVLLHKRSVFGRHLFVHECSEMVSATCNPKGAAYSAGAGCGQYGLELPAL